MSQNILFITATTIKERTGIHDNIDDKLIYPDIKWAQDEHLLPMLGTALYAKLQSDISGGTLAGVYKTLIDNYLVDCLVYFVLAELPSGLNYQFWNKGVATKGSDNSQSPSMSEMFDIVSKYKNRAEYYQKKAILYLKQQASLGTYPEYLNPGSGIDTVVPDRVAYSSPIYLGEVYPRQKRSYEEKYQGNIFRSCDDC